MTIFGGFWLPFGKPLELIFGTLGVILEVHKKNQKKDTNKIVKMVEGGRFCGMRGSPGEDYGGGKTQQKGEEQKGESKKMK